MKRLINLTPAEKRFLDDAVAAAERASGKKLNQPNRHIVLKGSVPAEGEMTP